MYLMFCLENIFIFKLLLKNKLKKNVWVLKAQFLKFKYE